MGRRARQKGVSRAAVRGALRGATAMHDKAAAVAQEVYEACVAADDSRVQAEDPLPLAIRGPLLALGARGAAAILMLHPELERSQETQLDLTEYLTEAWVTTMYQFDREHFEAWRSRTNVRGGSSA